MSTFKYAFTRSRRFELRRPRGLVSYFAGGSNVNRRNLDAYFTAHHVAVDAAPEVASISPNTPPASATEAIPLPSSRTKANAIERNPFAA